MNKINQIKNYKVTVGADATGCPSTNARHNKGITLLALVITIVLMLILATITVNVVINGGLFNYAGKAKQDTEIASEKETVQKATIIAETTSKTGRVTVTEMEKAMKNVANGSNTTIIEDVETIVVKFNNSNRYYTVDNKGNIEGPIETINDENSGDLSKGGEYLGTEESPYIINCIEDLVEFSQNYTTYETSFVILARTLDFKSIFSYNDYTTTEYGDLNGDGTEDDIKTELTKQGDDCGGFTPIASFQGTFDGQGYKICNLYENRGEENAGLFASSSGTIQNLGLENITLTGGGAIGGIVANGGTILNCFAEGHSQIKGSGYIGLICGQNGNIEECYSIGTLKLDANSGNFGGIIGFLNGGKIKKSYNIMDIQVTSSIRIAGVVGKVQWASSSIEECYHIGDITGSYVNGVVGDCTLIPTIKNCYSIGDLNGEPRTGGIVGGNGGDCFNCYSIGKITTTYCGGIINGMNYGGHLVHCFGRRGDFGTLPEGELTESQIISSLSSYNNTGYGHGANAQIGYECNVFTDDEMKTQEFVDELNILIVADDEGTITETEQNVWKMDTEGINNGYPIFTWQ